jgi:hypothetical protein
MNGKICQDPSCLHPMHVGRCEVMKTDRHGAYPCNCPDGYEKAPAPEELKAKWDAAQKAIEEERDNELVARWRHYERLANRMLVGDLKPGESCTYDPAEIRHLTEMLLLVDIARGATAGRSRSRYGGDY